MALSDLIRHVESGGNINARNPRSSAAGPDQFIARTWLAMIAKHRPDLAQGRTREEILALRTDPEIGSALNKEMTDAYASGNADILANRGLPVTPGTQYLAHFAGPQGAVGILNADPGASVASILGEGVIKANPFLANMTAADLTAWANRKMGPGSEGGPAPQAAQPAAAPPQFAAAPQGNNPLNIVPGTPAPAQDDSSITFGGGGNDNPAAYWANMPIAPLAPAQPFMPPRRRVDLAQLPAAFRPRLGGFLRG